MEWLAENPLPIWVGGVVALVLAVVIFLQTRTLGALLGIVAVVVVTAALLIVERLIETPREAVQRTLYELADRVEANDVPGTLSYIVPANNQMRTDVETLMPLVEIERAGILGSPEVEVHMERSPPEATVQCRGFVQAQVKQSGMRGSAVSKLEITFVQEGERWLVTDYTSSRDWRREIRP